MKEIWHSIDRHTQQPVSVSAFFSETSALRQIAAWKARRLAGARPDITEEMLDRMTPLRLRDDL